MPVLLELNAPEYPARLLFRGVEADVPCDLEIDAQGTVTTAECVADQDIGFTRPARDAMRGARFRPARIAGKPAASRLHYLYQYAISRERVEGHAVSFEVAGEVSGQIMEAGKRFSIAGADIVAQGLSVAVSADGKGNFRIQLPKGRHVLVVNAPDFVRAQLEVSVGDPPQTLYMRRSVVSDLSLVVPGERETHAAPSKETVQHEELRNVPGTQGDPVRVIENLPGLARVPFAGGQLIVRGAPAQDTGAYIDGQRIPILYHLLNGPSVLGEEMVDRIDLYPGGAGVFYGRSLSAVVAVSSRKGDPERWHGSLATDLQKTALFASGPLGGSTQIALGARRSYVNPFLQLFADKNRQLTLPVYWDYQARADTRLGKDRFALTIFGSNDSFEQLGGGRGSVPLALGKRIGFHRARLAWERRLSEDVILTVAPMIGFDLSDSSTSGAGPGVFARPQAQRERTLSGGARAELAWRAGDRAEVRAGLDVLFDRTRYDLDALYDLQLRGVGAPNAEEVRLSGVRVLGSFGEYLETELTFGRLRITPGLRFEQMHWQGHTYGVADPRLWARFTLDDATSLYAYGGLYHQAPTAEQVSPVIGNPGLLPEVAEQYGLGVERRLSALWSLKVEGYLNRRRSLVFPAEARALPDGTYDNPLQLNSGIGRSVGLEVLVRRQFTERLYGWLAYTLSRSRVLPRPGELWVPTLLDQPHILTLLLGFRPSPYVEFSTRIRLASGNPIAAADGATFNADSGNYNPALQPFGTVRLPTFLQVDFEVNNIWVGDYGRLQLYVDFQNLLDRANAEELLYDYRYGRSDYVTGVPFMASVGAQVSF